MAYIETNPQYSERDGGKLLTLYKLWQASAKEWKKNDGQRFRFLCVRDPFVKHLQVQEHLINALGLTDDSVESWRCQAMPQLVVKSEREVDEEVFGHCCFNSGLGAKERSDEALVIEN